jgi:hypothetical protein
MRFPAIILLLLLGCGEDKHYSFATGAEAARSEHATRGWIPAWLPPAAKRVELQYNLDTNEQWLRFDLGERDRAVLASRFRALQENEIVNLSFRSAPQPHLWFESLIVQHPSNDNGIHANVYAGDGVLLFYDKYSSTSYAYLHGQ